MTIDTFYSIITDNGTTKEEEQWIDKDSANKRFDEFVDSGNYITVALYEVITDWNFYERVQMLNKHTA